MGDGAEGRPTGPRRVVGVATAIVLLGVVGFLAAVVVRGEGNLAWDDSDYLRQGMRIAGLVETKGLTHLADPLIVRPKPPLLVAWIGAGRLLLGRRRFVPLIVFASVVPFALLLGAVVAVGRRLFDAPTALIAVLVLAASPMALSFGAKVMVESFMGLWVLLAYACAAMALDSPKRGWWLGLGAALGCALLTKLTAALLLPAPALSLAAAYLSRRPPRREALRRLAWVALPALAIAGPWYVKNGAEAVRFAFFSARYDLLALAKPDTASRWSRPLSLALGLAGWPVLAVSALAVVRSASRGSRPSAASREFVRLAAIGAGSGAALLLAPSYFDPRFLLPVWPSVALALADRIRTGVGDRLSGGACLLLAGLLAGLWPPASGVWREPRTTTYWGTRALIDQLVEDHQVATIANVGDCADWNVSKTGLINEMRADPSSCFVMHDLSRAGAAEIERRIGHFDVLIVLDREVLPPGFLREAPGLNRAYESIDAVLDRHRQFRRLDDVVAEGLPPMSVYVRRK